MGAPARDQSPYGLQRRFQLRLYRCPPHSHSKQAFPPLFSIFACTLSRPIHDHLALELPRVAAQARNTGSLQMGIVDCLAGARRPLSPLIMNARAWDHACIRAIGPTDESILAAAAYGSQVSIALDFPVFLPDVTDSGSVRCLYLDKTFPSNLKRSWIQSAMANAFLMET